MLARQKILKYFMNKKEKITERNINICIYITLPCQNPKEMYKYQLPYTRGNC